MALLEQTIASLACEIPGATRVFHKFKLDFCCGGQQPLKDAIAHRNLDVTVHRDCVDNNNSCGIG